jgi:hypothetical protein
MGDPEKRERKLAKKTGKILLFVKIKMKKYGNEYPEFYQ